MAIEINQKIVGDGIAKFGQDVQALKAVEELAELSQILTKQHIHPEKNYRNKIMEEVADVYVCLENVRKRYGLFDHEINLMIKAKQEKFKENHLT